jgi:HK97 family phage major capsid protein/HK97 family phage prohead protease
VKRPAILHRAATYTGDVTRGEDGGPDTYHFSLASDDPVEVWPGVREVLGHSADEVRLDWLKSGNAPLLWMHDHHQLIGRVTNASIDGGKTRVSVIFSDNPKAQEVKRDVDSGILRNVSVGYRIHEERLESSGEAGDTWRVTQWEPKEASFVTVPADTGVGMGRSDEEAEYRETLLARAQQQREPTKQTDIKEMANTTDNATEAPKNSGVEVVNETRDLAQELANERARGAAIRSAEREINRIAGEFKLEDQVGAAVARLEDGSDPKDVLQDFQRKALDQARNRSGNISQSDLGASKKESKRYSLRKVVEGLIKGDMAKHAGYELEVSDALKERGDRQSDNIAIPLDVLMRGYTPNDRIRATLGVGVGNSEVADIVDTELLDEMFIESLRTETVLLSQGVTMLGGLVGNVEIPRELTNPSFYWVAEDAEPTEGDYTMDKVSLSFATVGARIPFTRQAAKQSTPQIETLLTNSLRRGLAIEIENTLFNGTGSSNQPEGIRSASGIGSHSVTSNTVTRSDLFEARKLLGEANADVGSAVGFTNASAEAQLMTEKVDAGSGIFIGRPGGDNYINTDAFRIYCTNNIPGNLGVGTNESVIVYGVPRGLYVGMWGGVELNRDTATKVATGGVVLRVFQDLDCKVSRAAEWAVIDSIIA